MSQQHSETLVALNEIGSKTQGKRIVFVSGNFNIIHPGHLRLLRFAKECGDYLVVGVLDSRSDGNIINEELRLEGIRSISWVDYGFILRDSPALFIEKLKPAVVVKGKEHEEQYNPEAKAIAKIGGKLIFGSGDVTFSSIDLMRQEWKELNLSSIKKPNDFPERHKFNFKQLSQILDRMKELRVCVIGDIIIDEYLTCDALGMSQEDPTIVVTPILQEKFTGGASIVALHAKGLGANVHFFSVVGNDTTAEFAYNSIKHSNVNVCLYKDEERPTTLKQRYRVGQKTLLRVSHLRQHAINSEIRNKLFNDVISVIDDIDLLIFSDFSYGCLPQSLVDQIVEICSERNIMMTADSQSSSQIGDVSRFKGMTVITPTEREARFAVNDFESGLVVLAEKLRQKSFAKNVLITLAEEGVLMYAETSEKSKWHTDRLPALNSSPKDVAGAGDSFLACTSMSLACGADIWQSTYLGSLAAACQVGRVGNIPITHKELKLELET